MKVLFFCFLAFVAAVQARSAGVKTTALSAAENPWVVHLRIAVSTSGHLNSCVGSLIATRWVLTAASCVQNQSPRLGGGGYLVAAPGGSIGLLVHAVEGRQAVLFKTCARFIWIRYGAINVINPELVTETSSVRTFDDVALVSIGRNIEWTDTISSVPLAAPDAEVPSTGKLCGYGAGEGNAPGETLSCSEWTLEALEDGSIEGASEEGQATEFDVGAPLVSDGVQVGVLIYPAKEDSDAVFLNLAKYRDWIEAETGVILRSI